MELCLKWTQISLPVRDVRFGVSKEKSRMPAWSALCPHVMLYRVQVLFGVLRATLQSRLP